MTKNDFLTIAEFSELTGIPKPSAWDYARKSLLPTRTMLGVIVVARSDVQPFLDDLAIHRRFTARGRRAA